MKRNVLFAALILPLCACRSNESDDRALESQSPYPSAETRSTNPLPTATSITAAERSFAEQALRGGQFEVESSRLALGKASSETVRDFANMMILDHGQANQDLERLARKKGIYTSTMLDAEHQAKLEELRLLDGPAFDQRFQRMQIEAHDAAIVLFEKASRECHDADLRQFAVRTLPTLQKHRSHLDDVVVATSEGTSGGR